MNHPGSRSITKILLSSVLIFLAVMVAALSIAFSQKNNILDTAIEQLNKGFQGKVAIESLELTPFENFPYISIDLKNVEIHETKSLRSDTVVFIEDAYIGFDIWSILSGNYEVKKIKLSNGFLRIVEDLDGNLNVLSALASPDESGDQAEEQTKSSINFGLNAIELVNIDLLKINESNGILIEAFVKAAQSSFISSEESIDATLDTRLLVNLLIEGDTSFIHHKNISFSTAIKYDLTNEILTLDPTELQLEQAQFLMEGDIDVGDDMNLNLAFSGQKPNFDLFLAFAPEELEPALNRYANGGQVYFNASVTGPSINGKTPHVEVDFGCAEAFIENTLVKTSVQDLYFEGHFDNGASNSSASSSFIIKDFRARPETGNFEAQISVTNFESPDIEMQVASSFDLDFLADFLNLEDLENLSGKVSLEMNFHDIIDLDDPSKTIEQLNESYYTELKVENLGFSSPAFHLPIRNVNIDAFMDGHEAEIKEFSIKVGNSDLRMTASISDLPAIIHHTDLPVDVILNVSSSLIDLAEITQAESDTSGINEQIKDLALKFRFNSSARAFTESPNLPIGEFFIENLSADFTNYPHGLHDYRADVLIDSSDFRVIDFSGMIDQSDFHFDGKLANYHLWFEDDPVGTTEIDFNLTAEKLQMVDLLSYGGEEYIPEDYREEVFKNVKIHGITQMNFDREWQSIDLKIDKIQTYLQSHKMFLEQFNGDFYLDSAVFMAKEFGGQVGNSSFKSDLIYHLDDKNKDLRHSFSLRSPRLDFDQLFSYLPEEDPNASVDHAAAFNIFEVPFLNLDFDLTVDELNYHRYLLDDFVLEGRMQENHFIYVDTMDLKAAGGQVAMKGYFNGSDPKKIYFSPTMEMKKVDLEKLLFKFDNFGQDELVSDNLEGQLSGTVSGSIRMHPDLIPIIEESALDINARIYQGAIKNFVAFEAMSEYFADKNLSYVRFDTLENQMQLKNGELIIPAMRMNTSVGFFELSGAQNVDLNMDYAIRIPWSVIASASRQKLFGKKNQDTSENIDEIQYEEEGKRTRFLNIRVVGTPDDFDIALGKAEEDKEKSD